MLNKIITSIKATFRAIFVTSFFGWDNFKWLVREFAKMYSNEDSYFSKKRFESSIAFISATSLILGFVWLHRHTIQNSELLADAALLFGIAGYTVKQIQSEKKDVLNTSAPVVDQPVETPESKSEEEQG